MYVPNYPFETQMLPSQERLWSYEERCKEL